jgi:hypothetical protein
MRWCWCQPFCKPSRTSDTSYTCNPSSPCLSIPFTCLGILFLTLKVSKRDIHDCLYFLRSYIDGFCSLDFLLQRHFLELIVTFLSLPRSRFATMSTSKIDIISQKHIDICEFMAWFSATSSRPFTTSNCRVANARFLWNLCSKKLWSCEEYLCVFCWFAQFPSLDPVISRGFSSSEKSEGTTSSVTGSSLRQ